MPDVKVYIRTEDLEKWNSIEKKSEWLHNALGGQLIVQKSDLPEELVKSLDKAKTRTISVAEGIERINDGFVPKPPDPELGYPCCTKSKPCKHWAFDGAEGLWRNEITGNTREVI